MNSTQRKRITVLGVALLAIALCTYILRLPQPTSTNVFNPANISVAAIIVALIYFLHKEVSKQDQETLEKYIGAKN